MSDWTLPTIPTEWLPREVLTKPGPSEHPDRTSAEEWVPAGLPERSPEQPLRRGSSGRHQVPRSLLPPEPPQQQAEPPQRQAEPPQRQAEPPPAPQPQLVRRDVERPRPLRPPGSLRPGQTVNINTAPAEELVLLPGIGWRAAQRIVAFREEKGPYRSLAELTKVEGIHADRLKRLAPHARV